ncbi:hypothetical protein [Mycolicibacterium agri]|uniref:hypothetical protein n=1 Tax=Mycolicibacterium agri TaxID=36811 RepID=UPI001056A68B|nr:hypothetical protein [Mycolicibacterium agri]
MDDARYLAGPKEIGQVLGVEPNTVNVWQRRDASRPPFPAPIVRLAGGSIWDIRDVIAWADATGRTVQQRDYTAPGWVPDQPKH